MNQDQLWFLLARHLSDEASPAETEALHRLLREDPDNQYLTEIISTYFKAASSEMETDPAGADFNQRLNRILSARPVNPGTGETAVLPPTVTGIRSHRFRISRFLPYAAAILAIGFTIGMIHHSSKPPQQIQSARIQTSEVVARPGARTRLVLPDGTRVWLNSGSRLHYKNDFNARLREVNLEGEAFFDVVKQANHPFIVHTSSIDIKVLGTAFNVKSYPRDEVVETTLLRGSIEVTRKDDPSAPKVILRPNEKLTFSTGLSPFRLSAPAAPAEESRAQEPSNISVTDIPENIPDSEKVETSWMYNKLVFDGDRFQELAAKMERWYNVKIIFRDQRLLKYRFKGVFSNETIRDALDALRLTAAFSYKIKGNEVELNKE